jgi:hypothetical protein
VAELQPPTRRPVIFAVILVEFKKKKRMQSPVIEYIIDNLIKGCDIDSTSISLSVRTSHFSIDSKVQGMRERG